MIKLIKTQNLKNEKIVKKSKILLYKCKNQILYDKNDRF